MSRLVPRFLFLFTVFALAACTDANTPTGQDRRPGVMGDYVDDPALRTALTNQLATLFATAPGGIQTAASTMLNNVFGSMDKGTVKAAQQQAAALCKFTETQAKAGRLAASYPSDELTTFCNRVYATAHLLPGGIDVSGIDAAATYVPACQPVTLVVGTGRAGVRWAGGTSPEANDCTFEQDVTLIITPVDYHTYNPGSGPILNYPGVQVPYFYDITVVPYTTAQNGKLITISLCQLDDDPQYSPPESVHGQYRVAHNVTTTPAAGPTYQVLPWAPPFTSCMPTATASANFLGDLRENGAMVATRNAASFLGGKLKSLVAPSTLYATNIGAGGLSSSFSYFATVVSNDVSMPPTGTGFEVYPTYPLSNTPVCAGCNVTTQFGAAGLEFSFLPNAPAYTGGPLPAWLTTEAIPNSPNNHAVQNPPVDPTQSNSGHWTGAMTMDVRGFATYMDFSLRKVIAVQTTYTVQAYSGNTALQVFQGQCFNLDTQFCTSEVTISSNSSLPITRVVVTAPIGGGNFFVDNVTFTPPILQ